MKNNLFTLLIVVAAAVLTQLTAQRTLAQGLSLEQLKAVKTIKIANLEKDTYFKSGGYILDRYEERPAYVFTYSDGITRKIYLYKVYTAETTKDLGLLALYQNGKTGEVKPFVIPGADADRKAWDAYIDDLKYVGEKEPGLMSALTFVLSREMAGLLAGGDAKAEAGDKKKEEYNFCFAPDAPVTLPDGSVKAIADVAVGEVVLGYDAPTNTTLPTRVTRIDAHAGTFPLLSVWLLPADHLLAAQNALSTPVRFDATANHPVLTASGRKPLGNVTPGEQLYRYEAGQLTPYRVVRTEPGRTVTTVYNLVTEAGAYLIGETVVLDK